MEIQEMKDIAREMRRQSLFSMSEWRGAVKLIDAIEERSPRVVEFEDVVPPEQMSFIPDLPLGEGHG